MLDVKSDFENANSVKNRLKHSCKFWENVLKPSDYILNVVKFGYRLEFEDLPDRVFLKNNKSALDNSGFVERSIFELLGKDLIRECPQAPFCVNPLTVSVPANKKPRLILDLRHVNFFIVKRKVKFEGTKEGLNFAKKGNFMIKFDLTSGYHHINIHEDHHQYLGFSWKIDGKIRYFVFTVLPFGLSSAGYIFTKTLRPLVTHWRTNSFPVIMYLDDGWVCDTKENCERISSIIQTDLARAGFLVNQEKSIWEPSPKLDWLGFEWDLIQGVISIPFNKLENLRTKIKCIKIKKHVSARDLASIVGSIISFKFALGPICQMFTRNLSILIAKTAYWDQSIQLSKLESDELDFWFDNVLRVPNRVISPWFRIPDRMVFTDASDYAGAGVLLESNKEFFHTMWNDFDREQSSTYRELKTVDLFMKTFCHMLQNKFIKLYSDNQNVIKISQTGSMKQNLQSLAFSIYSTGLVNNIELSVAWIPRKNNEEADFYSKIFDYDDWGVHQNIFHYFDQAWGPFTCDVFASSSNFKVKKFYSQFWTPGSSGVDAFAFDWAQDMNWLVPPINLISKAIKHIIHCQAKGVLVVPKWKSSVFWPAIVDISGNFRWFIKQHVEYEKPLHFFCAGSDKNSIFAANKFNSNVLVLNIDAT